MFSPDVRVGPASLEPATAIAGNQKPAHGTVTPSHRLRDATRDYETSRRRPDLVGFTGCATSEGRLISAQTRSSDNSSTSAIAAIVAKEGVATRPDSIFRSVSGETPASRAVSSIGRTPLARRSTAPRRCPRSRSAAVSGNLTMDQ